MRILFVDEKDWTKKVPYTIHYLAEHLVEHGHSVFAVDFDDTWTHTHRFDLFAKRRRRPLAKLDQRHAVDLLSPSFVKLPVVSRLSTLATHSWEIARLLHSEAIDCIVTYGITNAPQTLLLGHWFNIPVAFHSIDMLGPLVPSRFLEKPAELIEQQLIRRSDCVLALTPVFAERARRLGAKRVAVIPNGVDIDKLRPGLHTGALRAELGLRDEKVILFVGTLTVHVGLDQFLRHLARMPLEGVKFVVVGDDIVTAGREMRRARELVRELGIEDHVIFTGLQPAQRVPLYINLADVCVSPFPPSKFSKLNIAMKVFEYMACGKPTITFQLEGTKSLVPPGAGGVVYVDTPGEMMAMIWRLLWDDQERIALGGTGRQLIEERFSWDSVTRDLQHVLLDLCSRRTGACDTA